MNRAHNLLLTPGLKLGPQSQSQLEDKYQILTRPVLLRNKLKHKKLWHNSFLKSLKIYVYNNSRLWLLKNLCGIQSATDVQINN